MVGGADHFLIKTENQKKVLASVRKISIILVSVHYFSNVQITSLKCLVIFAINVI